MITTFIKSLIFNIDTKELGVKNGVIEKYIVEFDYEKETVDDKIYLITNGSKQEIVNTWDFIWFEGKTGLQHENSWLYNHLIELGVSKKKAFYTCQTLDDIFFSDDCMKTYEIK